MELDYWVELVWMVVGFLRGFFIMEWIGWLMKFCGFYWFLFFNRFLR